MSIIIALESLITTAEKFKGAYFFTPPTSASARRSYEEYHSIPFFSFEYNGVEYTCEYRISCSCRNVYAQGIYTRNGNKTTLTAIKNVLKKMKAEKTTDEVSEMNTNA